MEPISVKWCAIVVLLIGIVVLPSFIPCSKGQNINSSEIESTPLPRVIALIPYAHINGTITNMSYRYYLFNTIIVGIHVEVIYLHIKNIRGESILIPGRFWYEFWSHVFIIKLIELSTNTWYIDAICAPFMLQTWPNY